MRFSERMGFRPKRTKFQIESMDQDLTVALWNAFQLFFLDTYRPDLLAHGQAWAFRGSNRWMFFRTIWWDFLKRPLDALPLRFEDAYRTIRHLFFEWEWNEVYDFIESVALVGSSTTSVDTDKFRSFCNETVLEPELSAYRFVGTRITPITGKTEASEIEEAIRRAAKSKLAGVWTHLNSALDMLSDRKKPDYRNSIKESISAVEAMCLIISQKPKASLGQALRAIEQGGVQLHPALREGFQRIYGYTSDEDGIRHAMVGESQVEFEDAKYMMVSCSAFVNYLIEKASEAGIKVR